MLMNKTSLKFILGFLTIVALGILMLLSSGYLGGTDTTANIPGSGVNLETTGPGE